MNVALLTAGGKGTRMNQDVPKQFITINNKPLIIYTLERFQNHPNIDAIIVACLSGWEPILEAYAKQYKITKLRWVVEGGNNGQESIYNCLLTLKENCPLDSIVLVHDGNRALVTNEIISNSIVTCKEKGSSIAVIPCNEVILKTDDQITSRESYDRDSLKRTQTPHTYSLEKLLWAHDEAKKKNITNSVATCDLMIQLGETVNFTTGSEKNIKITTVDDVEIFKALISSNDDNDGLKR